MVSGILVFQVEEFQNERVSFVSPLFANRSMGDSMPMIHGPKKYSVYREATSSCAWTTEYDRKHQEAELHPSSCARRMGENTRLPSR